MTHVVNAAPFQDKIYPDGTIALLQYPGEYGHCDGYRMYEPGAPIHILQKVHEISVHDKNILVNFLYLNILDRPDYQQEMAKNLMEILTFICQAILDDKKVYVHCRAGVSRSATIAAAYLMVTTNQSINEIIGEIQKCRPCVHPNEGFKAILATLEHMPSFTALKQKMRPTQ